MGEGSRRGQGEYDHFIEELLILYADGTKIEVSGVAPIINKKTGEVVNANRVTVWDAGYVSPRAALPDYSGAGWNHISITTLTRVPSRSAASPAASEGRAHHAYQDDRGAARHEIAPLIGDRIGVLITDGGFFSRHINIPRARPAT